MKAKKEYIILVAVILALLLYLFLRRSDKIRYQLPELPNVAGSEISKIEIAKLNTSIILSKKDNRWHITPQGYPADNDKVKDMLDIIGELTPTDLVSESKEYNRYDLSNDKKITVRAWAGGDTLRREFEVGKAAPSFRHTFIKLAGDDRVYQARKNFRSKFDQTVENLWDRTVLSFDRTEIQEVEITKGGQSILFGRKQTPVEVTTREKADEESHPPAKPEIVWESADGEKGDESKLDSLLTTLSNLRCEKYIENRKKDGFTNPLYTMRLKGTQDLTLEIFVKTDKAAKNYPATSSQSDFPFFLADQQADNIMRDPEEMLEKPDKP
jgi:hypothetical protein